MKNSREDLIKRLKRIEGQTRGLQKLLAESDDCEKVAQQLSATRKALDKCFFASISCMMEQELGEKQASRIEYYNTLLTKYA